MIVYGGNGNHENLKVSPPIQDSRDEIREWSVENTLYIFFFGNKSK